MSDQLTGGASHAYTRGAVDDYLKAVAGERSALHDAIAAAQLRVERAVLAHRRLAALEQSVGQAFVAAYARAKTDGPAIGEAARPDPAPSEAGPPPAPAALPSLYAVPPPPGPVLPPWTDRTPPPKPDEASPVRDAFGGPVGALPDRNADDYFHQLGLSVGRVDVDEDLPRTAWAASRA